MLKSISALISLGLALLWAALKAGGVSTTLWDYSILAIGLISLFVFLAAGRTHRTAPLNRPLQLSIIAVLCYAAFQLVPLPLAVLDVLSPARAQLTRNLAPIIGGVHWAPISVNPPVSVYFLFTLLSYTATFLIVYELCRRFPRQPWAPVIPLIAIGSLEALMGMFQVLAGSDALATGTYQNHDHFSGLLEIILPLTVLCGLSTLRRRRNRHDSPAGPAVLACFIWAIAALMLIAIIYSLSRGGILVAVATLFSIAALTIGPRLPSRRLRYGALGAMAASVLLVMVFSTPEQLFDRFGELAGPDGKLGDVRPQLYQETLPLIKEFRWFGTGLGGYESTFLKYRAVLSPLRVSNAHDDYLQALVELGIVGSALLGLVLFWILAEIFKGAFKLRDDASRYILIGCAGSFIAILLHSFVDFNMYVPANAMTLAWTAGIAAGTASINRRD